jgi:hypothetical protein
MPQYKYIIFFQYQNICSVKTFRVVSTCILYSYLYCCTKHNVRGRAVAQVASRLLPTSASRVRSKIKSCRICGGQSGTTPGFLRFFRFFCQLLFRRILYGYLSSWAGTVGPILATRVPSALRLILRHVLKKKVNKIIINMEFQMSRNH